MLTRAIVRLVRLGCQLVMIIYQMVLGPFFFANSSYLMVNDCIIMANHTVTKKPPKLEALTRFIYF